MATNGAFIYDAIRTPRGKGKSNGSLHTTKSVDLVVTLLHEMLARHNGLDPTRIDDVVLGCVTPIGDQGMDIARTAVLKAGLPDTVPGFQLNRFCSSGMDAVIVAGQKDSSGWEDLVMAGGVESMSRVPIGSDGGAWAMDPETNFATSFVPQGISADLIATLEDFTREDCFQVTADRKAKVPLMRAVGEFRYADDDTVQALELPYRGKDLAMFILLPRKLDGLPDVEKELAGPWLSGLQARLQRAEVSVFLPRASL